MAGLKVGGQTYKSFAEYEASIAKGGKAAVAAQRPTPLGPLSSHQQRQIERMEEQESFAKVKSAATARKTPAQVAQERKSAQATIDKQNKRVADRAAFAKSQAEKKAKLLTIDRDKPKVKPVTVTPPAKVANLSASNVSTLDSVVPSVV